MTDEELIAMARLAQRDERMSTGALYGDLADRIEALGKACTEWAEVSQSNYRRASTSEAKLAKVVKARREDALELLAALGQAQEAHEAQLKAEARAERLEEALRFYADDETYETQYWRRSCGCCTDIFEPINDDRGAKARAALKGTEHDG